MAAVHSGRKECWCNGITNWADVYWLNVNFSDTEGAVHTDDDITWCRMTDNQCQAICWGKNKDYKLEENRCTCEKDLSMV